MPSNAVSITQDLIRCPSVTPVEGGALATLEKLLGDAGFAVSRVTFRDEDTPDVENLFATIGSGKPHFVFAGHTDVVPAGAASDWSQGPFDGNIKDGVLYGRGAVDMKGGVAAFAAAALDFVEEFSAGFGGTISFLITGDEEGPAVNGTVKLLEWAAGQGHTFDACIVGEPTNPEKLGDAIKVGRRGSLSGIVTVSGIQGHAAYPHLADNPIPGLTRLLAALDVLELDLGNERFQPSNLEIVNLDVGNSAFNVIPARAEARFNIRFNDEWSLESLKSKILETLQAVNLGDLELDVAFKRDASESFLTKDDKLIETLGSAVKAETGRSPELSTGGGTSDARFIKNYCPVVEFGLVGQTMHKVDECVSIEDLDRLATIYKRFLVSYFAKDSGAR
ncbi:succinyl-diaminopimelate desuccinylase [Roseibium album]|uniref:Succinyl-diaminopimelate desuccinylase n=1 Tax=Roseibium album TaxID=311410 RepID=A0A0M7AX96_9HYPH|nr:succinyl-diaminopimelate desuccinylase [Roseibium album]CTQ62022.1 Succinyl-diaminopimelate desuccinylase [Roseibium album]CTQ78363.1 Succinyl-diaminopimelate desuccinylase [Roseibium album]CTQ79787.1 Succinyl-diaminopimelate desuccinylase [Roseibium album]